MRVADKFDFKKFSVYHDRATIKVGTDAVLLGAWADVTNVTRILDVGTGSGVIALMLAQRTPEKTHIDAIDISLADCEQATENVVRSPWPQKISVHHSSLQLYESSLYDHVVSNPPYFINSFKPPVINRANARHTETLQHHELLHHTKRLLNSTGKLSVVLPPSEANLLQSLSKAEGWFCKRICRFQSRINKPVERVLLEFQLTEISGTEEELVLYNEDSEWSAAYRDLTKGFYLNI